MRNLLKRSNRVMLFFSLSLLIMITTSCQDVKLKVAIESANKQCPMEMGEFGKTTSIVYDGQNVVYTFNVDEVYTNIKTLKEHPENLKSSMTIMFQNPTKDVKALRERTGSGMMDCKKALTEAGGDIEKAAEILREKGLASAVKKAGRIAAEGIVSAYKEGNIAVLLEVNCETDFVAKTEQFKSYC